MRIVCLTNILIIFFVLKNVVFVNSVGTASIFKSAIFTTIILMGYVLGFDNRLFILKGSARILETFKQFARTGKLYSSFIRFSDFFCVGFGSKWREDPGGKLTKSASADPSFILFSFFKFFNIAIGTKVP